jgi:hypothetical protein
MNNRNNIDKNNFNKSYQFKSNNNRQLNNLYNTNTSKSTLNIHFQTTKNLNNSQSNTNINFQPFKTLNHSPSTTLFSADEYFKKVKLYNKNNDSINIEKEQEFLRKSREKLYKSTDFKNN